MLSKLACLFVLATSAPKKYFVTVQSTDKHLSLWQGWSSTTGNTLRFVLPHAMLSSCPLPRPQKVSVMCSLPIHDWHTYSLRLHPCPKSNSPSVKIISGVFNNWMPNCFVHDLQCRACLFIPLYVFVKTLSKASRSMSDVRQRDMHLRAHYLHTLQNITR